MQMNAKLNFRKIGVISSLVKVISRRYALPKIFFLSNLIFHQFLQDFIDLFLTLERSLETDLAVPSRARLAEAAAVAKEVLDGGT